MEIRFLLTDSESMLLQIDKLALCSGVKALLATKLKCAIDIIKLFFDDKEISDTTNIYNLQIPPDKFITVKKLEEKNIQNNNIVTVPKFHPISRPSSRSSINPSIPKRKYRSDPQDFAEKVKYIENMGYSHFIAKQMLRINEYNTDKVLNQLKFDNLSRKALFAQAKQENTQNNDIKTTAVDNPELIRKVNQINNELRLEKNDFYRKDPYMLLDSICDKKDPVIIQEDKQTEEPAKHSSNLRAKRWSYEEEEMLVSKYAELGPNWNAIAEFIPGRTSSAIMQHYTIHSRHLMSIKPKPGLKAPIRQAVPAMPKSQSSNFPTQPNFDMTFDPNDNDFLFEAWKVYQDDWEAIACALPQYTANFLYYYWTNTLYPQLLLDNKIPHDLIMNNDEMSYRTPRNSRKKVRPQIITTPQSTLPAEENIQQPQQPQENDTDNESESKSRNYWTQEEENIVIDMKMKGATFEEIAEMLPNRTSNTISTRWYTKLQKIASNSTPLSENDKQPSDNDYEEELDENAANEQAFAGLVKRQWTAKEDELLMQLYQEHHTNWEKINTFFQNRTPAACRMHWYFLRNNGNNGGNPANEAKNSDEEYNEGTNAEKDFKRTYNSWTEEEDKKLIAALERKASWREIFAMFPDRKDTSIRTHCQCTLKKKIKNLNLPSTGQRPWTADEDKRIIEMRTAGRSWQEILQTLSGRTQNALVSRWNVKLKYLADNKDKPKLKNVSFSKREENMILSKKREGLSWENIAALFPPKKAPHVKSYYDHYLRGEFDDGSAHESENDYRNDLDELNHDVAADKNEWTPAEDQIIIEELNKKTLGSDIVKLFPEKAKIDVYRRIETLKETFNLNKKPGDEQGSWTEQEDAVILTKMNDNIPAQVIDDSLPGRSATMITERYNQLIKKDI